MKARKITLGVAALALALPAALAASSSGASASGVPPVVIDTSGIPPLCPQFKVVCDELATVESTASHIHETAFTGTYYAKTNSFNDTSDINHPGTCADGPTTVATQQLCRLTFKGGDPKKACNPSPTSPWSKVSSGDAWTFYPNVRDQSIHIGSPQLFAEGGGVIDDNGVTTGSDGNLVVYRIHIQIAALCGNEDTAQGLVDNITATSGLGSIDLSATYKFSGYVDIG